MSVLSTKKRLTSSSASKALRASIGAGVGVAALGVLGAEAQSNFMVLPGAQFVIDQATGSAKVTYQGQLYQINAGHYQVTPDGSILISSEAAATVAPGLGMGGGIVGSTVGLASDVVGGTVGLAGNVVGGTLNTANTLVGDTVGLTTDVVTGTVETGGEIISGVSNFLLGGSILGILTLGGLGYTAWKYWADEDVTIKTINGVNVAELNTGDTPTTAINLTGDNKSFDVIFADNNWFENHTLEFLASDGTTATTSGDFSISGHKVTYNGTNISGQTLTLQVTDNQDNTDTVDFVFSYNDGTTTNGAPTLAAITPTAVSEGAVATVFDANATDPEGDAITYSIDNTANFTINSTNGVVQTKSTTSAGSYTVVVTATDAHGNAVSQSVAVTVTAASANTAPIFGSAAQDYNQIAQGGSIEIATPVDAEGDSFTYSIVSAPTGFTLSSDGTSIDVASSVAIGNDYQIVVRATDSHGAVSAQHTMTVDVTSASGGSGSTGTAVPVTYTDNTTITHDASEDGHIVKAIGEADAHLEIDEVDEDVVIDDCSDNLGQISVNPLTGEKVDVTFNIDQAHTLEQFAVPAGGGDVENLVLNVSSSNLLTIEEIDDSFGSDNSVPAEIEINSTGGGIRIQDLSENVDVIDLVNSSSSVAIGTASTPFENAGAFVLKGDNATGPVSFNGAPMAAADIETGNAGDTIVLDASNVPSGPTAINIATNDGVDTVSITGSDDAEFDINLGAGNESFTVLEAAAAGSVVDADDDHDTLIIDKIADDDVTYLNFESVRINQDQNVDVCFDFAQLPDFDAQNELIINGGGGAALALNNLFDDAKIEYQGSVSSNDEIYVAMESTGQDFSINFQAVDGSIGAGYGVIQSTGSIPALGSKPPATGNAAIRTTLFTDGELSIDTVNVEGTLSLNHLAAPSSGFLSIQNATVNNSASTTANEAQIDNTNALGDISIASLTSDAATFTYVGSEGRDIINGVNMASASNVSFTTAEGDDRLILDLPAAASLSVDLGDGDDSVQFASASSIGGAATVEILGGKGDDTIDLSNLDSGGSDIDIDIVGGTGMDTITLSAAGEARETIVIADVSDTSARAVSSGQLFNEDYDVITGFEINHSSPITSDLISIEGIGIPTNLQFIDLREISPPPPPPPSTSDGVYPPSSGPGSSSLDLDGDAIVLFVKNTPVALNDVSDFANFMNGVARSHSSSIGNDYYIGIDDQTIDTVTLFKWTDTNGDGTVNDGDYVTKGAEIDYIFNTI